MCSHHSYAARQRVRELGGIQGAKLETTMINKVNVDNQKLLREPDELPAFFRGLVLTNDSREVASALIQFCRPLVSPKGEGRSPRLDGKDSAGTGASMGGGQGARGSPRLRTIGETICTLTGEVYITGVIK